MPGNRRAFSFNLSKKLGFPYIFRTNFDELHKIKVQPSKTQLNC